MTAVTFPLRPPRLAFAICGWRWQNDVHEIKYSVRLKKKNGYCQSFFSTKFLFYPNYLKTG